ncbi:MAG: glucose-6-phosphate dehydrogenase [Spirochaetes bacterium]|nr:glucose-6-phosphate dehydrogenase [Spirochaetota bacterium]
MSIGDETYPVCNLQSLALVPDAACFVVLGATGDLSRRKIFPALFDLFSDSRLPETLVMLGFARHPLLDQDFRHDLEAGCRSYARRREFDEAAWQAFSSRIFYLEADLEEAAGYERLARVLGGRERLPGLPESQSLPANALFYLAVSPEHFGPIADRLGSACLGSSERSSGAVNPSGLCGWRRLVVEKPYGADGKSARELTRVLQRNFKEEDIYRIDHYLGKETVQNLLYIRFSNSIFEPLWNRNHIESIDISVFETEGIGQRGGYYDKAGASRDMLQNHLIQLMCLTTMEPPASLDPESIHDEKVKVLKSITLKGTRDLLSRSRRGQYTRGSSPGGKEIPAYVEEAKVRPDSRTETYVSLRLELDNWRFSGVPITLRTGKAFADKYSQIVIHFRRPPTALFAAQCRETLVHNALTIRIQPDEGVWLRFNAKVPGMPSIKPSELRFSYRETADYLPEAYERLITDALSGDSTLFIRADESEEAWRIVDALEKAWSSADPMGNPFEGGLLEYAAGSPVPELER